MDITRRNKYKGSGRTVNKSGNYLDINFDIHALNLMCSYVISENKNIRRSHLINLRNLAGSLNEQLYISDPERMKRLDFIKKGLDAKIVKNLKDPSLVLKFINGGISEDNGMDIRSFAELSNSELDWITETVSESLKYSYIYTDINRLADVVTRFNATDYRSRGEIVGEIEMLITQMQNKFRKVSVESINEMMFTLKPESYGAVVSDIYDQLTDPSSVLLTGMQGFNSMLSNRGGFEAGRVYLFLGLTGGGKSLSLLDLAYQMKLNNRQFKPKDPTKTPVIVYLTMENTVKETVGRLFEMATGEDIENQKSAEDVQRMLEDEGELYLSDNNPVDIIVKFVPNRSVDTSYLYTMVEDLEDEGYEVICLVQDHVKRIRSIENINEPRFELGAVINEFKTFGQLKDIPVITNSHLNRDAAGKVDEGARTNKGDLIRMLGRNNVGESMLMLDNSDGVFIIAQEYDQEGQKYLGVKRVKSRAKETGSNSVIYLPYLHPRSPKLVEDLYEVVPTFKETLVTIPTEANIFNGGARYQGELKDIDELLNDSNRRLSDENVFEQANSKPSFLSGSTMKGTE